MRLLSTLLLSAALVGLSGCLPSRDNLNDPVDAPDLVVDALPTGFVCSAASPAAPSEWQPVFTASRGACLALDVRADAHGGAPITTSTRTEWFVVATNGALTALRIGQQLLYQDAPGLVVVDPEFTRSLGLTKPVTFAARVNGHFDATLISLTNSPPTAVGDPPRVLPIGGYPWAPSATVAVTLNGARSSDPDGDPLQFTWTLPDGSTVSSAAGSSTAQVMVSTKPGRTVLQLVANDGVARSQAAPVTIAVGAPNLWGATGNGGPAVQLQRLDELSTLYPLPNFGDHAYAGPAGVAILTRGTASFMVESSFLPAVAGEAPPLQLYSIPAHDALGPTVSLSTAFSLALSAITGGGTRLWAYGGADDPAVPALGAFDLNAGATALTAGPLIYLPGSVPSNPAIALDSNDGVWIADLGTTTLGYTPGASPGIPIALSTSAGRVVAALAARPGTGEMWELENRGLQQGASVGIFKAGSPTQWIGLGANASATALAWVDSHTLWLALAGEGVRLLDADTFVSDHNLGGDTLVEAAFPDFIRALVLDPDEGGVWASSADPTLVRIAPDGSSRSFPDNRIPLLVDPLGAVWFSDPSLSPGRGEVPLTSGFAASIPDLTGAPFLAVADDRDGSIWTWSPEVGSLQRWAQDGTLLKSYPGYQPAPGEPIVPFPNAPDGSEALFLPSPNSDGTGTFAWIAFPGGQVYRFDLEADPPQPAPGAVLGTAALVAGLQLDSFLQAYPVPGQTPFVWATRIDGTGFHLSTIALDGTAHDVVGLSTAAEGVSLMSVSQVSNRVCFAAVNGGALSVNWISPDGTVSSGIQSGLVAGTQLLSVQTARDSSGSDVCWTLATTIGPGCGTPGTAVLSVWNSTASLLHTDTAISIGNVEIGNIGEPQPIGVGTSMTAISDTDAWFYGQNCAENPQPTGPEFIHAAFDTVSNSFVLNSLQDLNNVGFSRR